MMSPFNREMRNTDARKISQSFHWSSEISQGFFTGNRKKQRVDSRPCDSSYVVSSTAKAL